MWFEVLMKSAKKHLQVVFFFFLKKLLLSFCAYWMTFLKVKHKNGIHKNVFLVDNNKILFLTTFITLTAIFFQKNRQAASWIPTLNNELSVTEGSMEWKIFYWHRHYSSRLFWHFYCLLNVGRVEESGELTVCMCICMHKAMCDWS